MKPPELKYVGYFGDTDPVAYGGGFVYTDATGVYQPHVEYIEPAADDEWHETKGKTPLTIYRFDIDQLATVPYVHREVSGYRELHGHTAFTFPHLVAARLAAKADALPHPIEKYDEWFNTADTCNAESMASYVGLTVEEWQAQFCSDDPMVRVRAYIDIGQYAGFENLDSYPLTMTEDEAYERYAEEMKLARQR